MAVTRKATYSESDKERLLDSVFSYRDIVENKKTDHATNKAKAATWGIIANEYNKCYVRFPESRVDFRQLQMCYENLKKKARKIQREESEQLEQPGDGVFISKLTPLLKKVLEILDEHVPTVLDIPIDSDVNNGTLSFKIISPGMPRTDHDYLVGETADVTLAEMELDMSVSACGDEEISGTPSPDQSKSEKDPNSAGSAVLQRRPGSRNLTPYLKKRMQVLDKLERGAEARIELYQQMKSHEATEHDLRMQVLNAKLNYYEAKRMAVEKTMTCEQSCSIHQPTD